MLRSFSNEIEKATTATMTTVIAALIRVFVLILKAGFLVLVSISDLGVFSNTVRCLCKNEAIVSNELSGEIGTGC